MKQENVELKDNLLKISRCVLDELTIIQTKQVSTKSLQNNFFSKYNLLLQKINLADLILLFKKLVNITNIDTKLNSLAYQHPVYLAKTEFELPLDVVLMLNYESDLGILIETDIAIPNNVVFHNAEKDNCIDSAYLSFYICDKANKINCYNKVAATFQPVTQQNEAVIKDIVVQLELGAILATKSPYFLPYSRTNFDDSHITFITAYCEFGNALDFLRSYINSLEVDELLHLFHQILEISHILDLHQICHGDLSVHNILIYKDNNKFIPKMTGFSFSGYNNKISSSDLMTNIIPYNTATLTTNLVDNFDEFTKIDYRELYLTTYNNPQQNLADFLRIIMFINNLYQDPNIDKNTVNHLKIRSFMKEVNQIIDSYYLKQQDRFIFDTNALTYEFIKQHMPTSFEINLNNDVKNNVINLEVYKTFLDAISDYRKKITWKNLNNIAIDYCNLLNNSTAILTKLSNDKLCNAKFKTQLTTLLQVTQQLLTDYNNDLHELHDLNSHAINLAPKKLQQLQELKDLHVNNLFELILIYFITATYDLGMNLLFISAILTNKTKLLTNYTINTNLLSLRYELLQAINNVLITNHTLNIPQAHYLNEIQKVMLCKELSLLTTFKQWVAFVFDKVKSTFQSYLSR